MRYQPTIDLDAQTQMLLREGLLKLQCGQWVRTHPSSKPSRWVGVTSSGTLWAAHYQGADGYREVQFRSMAAVRRHDPRSFL